MTAEQRAAFDRDGYLIIRGAMGPDEAAAARDAIDRVYASMAKAAHWARTGRCTCSARSRTARKSPA